MAKFPERLATLCTLLGFYWFAIHCSQVSIDLFTDTAAILNSIVLTEKLWAAEGVIAGKIIVYTAFRINFYCLSLIFHNK